MKIDTEKQKQDIVFLEYLMYNDIALGDVDRANLLKIIIQKKDIITIEEKNGLPN